MNTHDEIYSIDIAGLKRSLPIIEIAPGLKIAVLNILGDTELVESAAKHLNSLLNQLDYDVIVTPEAKSIPLAYALSVISKKPYVVLRKTQKLYMGKCLQAETVSITTGKPQTLFLDIKDRKLIANSNILLLDDVISTGSTSVAMRKLLNIAEGNIVGEAAILTEGDKSQWEHIYSLGHLPVFD